MEPKIFVGRNLDPDEPGFYFQDVDSYYRGIRFKSSTEADGALFEIGTERHILEYEHALDELLKCSLRRQRKTG